MLHDSHVHGVAELSVGSLVGHLSEVEDVLGKSLQTRSFLRGDPAPSGSDDGCLGDGHKRREVARRLDPDATGSEVHHQFPEVTVSRAGLSLAGLPLELPTGRREVIHT